MNICETLEDVKKLCKPMKIYNPITLEWYEGRIWKTLSGDIHTISEIELEWGV